MPLRYFSERVNKTHLFLFFKQRQILSFLMCNFENRTSGIRLLDHSDLLPRSGN